MILVRFVCAADGSPTSLDGRWVMRWNPHTKAGTLDLVSTTELAQARRFSSAQEVPTEYRTQSRVQSKRPWDKQPNRPLAGVHIEMVPEERATEPPILAPQPPRYDA
jgi:hypothetical protein